MMMTCESMPDSYAKYIQFFRTFDARDGIRKRKMVSPIEGGGQSFPVTWSYVLSY